MGALCSLVCVFTEYEKWIRWEKFQLSNIVALMEAWGYACYFEGRPWLTKLGSMCWHPTLEFKDFSNVVCVLKAINGQPHQLYADMDKMSYLAGL